MSIPGFDEWLATPQGQYVLDWEQNQHDQVVADIFGFNALQIGLPGHDFLRANRTPFHFRCHEEAGQGRCVRARASFLPFDSASLDLVVLPHVLEFDPMPHQILREVERILVPEGHLVITGFNPFSLWGLRRKFGGVDAAPPWCGQYISVPRLKDWFALLSFEPRAGSFGCYAPPATQQEWLRRFHFMELAGDRWWPIAGGTYIIHAVKRVPGMTLITPVWQSHKARSKGLAPIAHSNKNDLTHN
jgi:SAM-dependent methyltransferase